MDAEAEVVRAQLRDLMWADAGIARSNERLSVAMHELNALRGRTESLFWQCVDTATVELRNLLEVATLVVACAQERKESRGLHYNVDYPHRDNERFLRDTLVTRAQV